MNAMPIHSPTNLTAQTVRSLVGAVFCLALVAVVSEGCSNSSSVAGGGPDAACSVSGKPPGAFPVSPLCTGGVKCANNPDCGSGEHCNGAMNPPMCETLYCGAAGTSCDDDALCAKGLRCVKGICNPCNICGTLCEVDFNSDPQHCGCCDQPVPKGGSCNNGQAACPEGQTVCDGTCRDLMNDPANCGACGNVLPSGVLCVGGNPACKQGLTFCGDHCADLSKDKTDCGECGATCTAGYCTGGVCAVESLVPNQSCNQICTSTGMTCAATKRQVAQYDCANCPATAPEIGCNKAPAATIPYLSCSSCPFTATYCYCAAKPK